MRLNYKSPILLKKADRDLHKNQLLCIEQCIRILFSEPTPNPAIQLLQKNDKTYKPPICSKSPNKISQDTKLSVFDIIKGYNPWTNTTENTYLKLSTIIMASFTPYR